MGSKKTKTKNEPWAPAQPYILEGMRQTQQVFNDNQPRLQEMSRIAQDAFTNISKSAFDVPNPYVTAAQNAAQNIFQGGFSQNPGQGTYDSLMKGGAVPRSGNPSLGKGRDPSTELLSGMARDNPAAAALAAGGINPATSIAKGVANGRYLNAQPSADLYSTVMGSDYLNGNPYLDSIVAQTNADVAKQANRMFGARGMGSGVSSAFADLMSKNLANSEAQLRYQNYNDAANRQLQAAGQSDAAWSGERGRMDSATGLLSSDFNAAQNRSLQAAQSDAQTRLGAAQALGTQFGQGQDRALDAARLSADQYNQAQNRSLEAAQAADAQQNSRVGQMLQALALTGDLRNADYAGIAPALSLLNSAADIPYVGTAALNGQIRQASDGYGISTAKTSGGLGGAVGGLASSFIGGLGGGLGTNVARGIYAG